MTDIPRPKRHLVEMAKRYPDAWRLADELRADRGKGLPHWPDWCFLPLGGAHAIIGRGRQLSLHEVEAVAKLGALAAWRVTQGIYRFDPDLLRALWETPVEGERPIDILFHLPEWCVYIETPGELFNESPLHGFFAHLEHDNNNGRAELRLLLDTGDTLDDLKAIPLHLVSGGITESLASMAEDSSGRLNTFGIDISEYIPDIRAEVASVLAPVVTPLVSLILYLCSSASEYIGDRLPSRPRPVKTKRGPRLFPPDHPTVWQTGFRLGAALRRAENERRLSQGEESERRSPRSHIRRAHWHAFWTGPRSQPERRKLVVHWIPPTPVNVGDIDDIIPTIRSVESRKDEPT